MPLFFLSSADHKEAVRLGWKSRHVPVLSILAVCWAAAGVISAVLSILAESSNNPFLSWQRRRP